MAATATPPYEAYEYCRRITNEAAGNFRYAFATLPRARRRAMYAAYAYCRLCDDLSDDDLPPAEKTLRLHELDTQLNETQKGNPEGPIFEALAHAANEFGIPYEDLGEVARGVEMDVTISRYETFDELAKILLSRCLRCGAHLHQDLRLLGRASTTIRNRSWHGDAADQHPS